LGSIPRASRSPPRQLSSSGAGVTPAPPVPNGARGSFRKPLGARLDGFRP
jgi:hypothetical protein